jgi:hypothetical protein
VDLPDRERLAGKAEDADDGLPDLTDAGSCQRGPKRVLRVPGERFFAYLA